MEENKMGDNIDKMEEDNLQSVGDKDHRIFACLECENP